MILLGIRTVQHYINVFDVMIDYRNLVVRWVVTAGVVLAAGTGGGEGRVQRTASVKKCTNHTRREVNHGQSLGLQQGKKRLARIHALRNHILIESITPRMNAGTEVIGQGHPETETGQGHHKIGHPI